MVVSKSLSKDEIKVSFVRWFSVSVLAYFLPKCSGRMVLSSCDISTDSCINNFHHRICFVSKQKLCYCGSLLVKLTVVTF